MQQRDSAVLHGVMLTPNPALFRKFTVRRFVSSEQTHALAHKFDQGRWTRLITNQPTPSIVDPRRLVSPREGYYNEGYSDSGSGSVSYGSLC